MGLHTYWSSAELQLQAAGRVLGVAVGDGTGVFEVPVGTDSTLQPLGWACPAWVCGLAEVEPGVSLPPALSCPPLRL